MPALGLMFVLAGMPGGKLSLAGEAGHWIELFNGKDLAGWKANEDPASFGVRDGMIVARACGAPIQGQAPHPKSHLFYVGPDGHASFGNFEFQVDVKCEHHANSGVYFHTEFVENAWPQKGFEIQIDNNSAHPKKTGSLYAVADVAESPARDNEWFQLRVIVRGKRVVIKIDGKTVVDWTEPDGFVANRPPWYSERKLSRGTFALQGHDAHSTVYFKNLRVKPLPAEVVVSGSPAKQRAFAGAYKALRLGRVGGELGWLRDPVWRQRMADLFKRYGFRVFRLHFPEYQHWKSPVTEWGHMAPLWGGTVKDILGDEEFLAWLAENDFKGIVTANVKNFYDPVRKGIFELEKHPEYVDAAAAEQAELVALAKQRGYAGRIYYWELGNEEYHTTPPEFFADVCARFMCAMKKADPAIRLGVVAQAPDWIYQVPNKGWRVGDTAQQPGWTTRFLTELKRLGIPTDWVDFAVHHAYAEDPPQVALASLKSPDDTPPIEGDWAHYQRPFRSQTGSAEALAALLDKLGYARTRIDVNEFKRGGYNSYYGRSFMNGLANADAWMSLLQHPRVSGALIWDSFNGGDFGEDGKGRDGKGTARREQGYGIFMRVGDRFLASPVAEMYQLFDRLLADGDDVLTCRADTVYAVATRGSRGVKVLVLNKGNECDVGIRLEGIALPQHGRAAVCEMQCDDLGAFTVHPWTGEVRSFPIVERPSAATDGNLLTYRLRRQSLTLFKIPQ